MKKFPPMALIALALLGTHGARAAGLEDELKACRQLTEPARRLGCYDALPIGAVAASSAAAAAAPAVVARPPADPVASFGQERIKPPADAPAELKQIESRVRGHFTGWDAGSRLELENGQIWRIADDSSATYDLQAPRAFVRRGLLGSFYLEVEGVPFQARVTRVR